MVVLEETKKSGDQSQQDSPGITNAYIKLYRNPQRSSGLTLPFISDCFNPQKIALCDILSDYDFKVTMVGLFLHNSAVL